MGECSLEFCLTLESAQDRKLKSAPPSMLKSTVTALLLAAAGLYAVIAYLVSQGTERDWDSSCPRRNTSTHPAFDDRSRDEIDADRCNDRSCWSDSGHTFNEEPFVCSGAHRSNDLWHFLCRFDRRRIGGLLYPGTTAHESRSTSRAEIRITCHTNALGGGSFWTILSYNLHTDEVHNYWAWDHMHNAPMGYPLLVLDMYEHAYHMDYGAAVAKYIEAFMQNVNWDEVNRRVEEIRIRK